MHDACAALGVLMRHVLLRGVPAPEAAPHPLHVGIELSRDLVPQGQVHSPGQQQVIDGGHQPQPNAVAQRLITGQIEAEINIGARLLVLLRPRPKQPDCLQARNIG